VPDGGVVPAGSAAAEPTTPEPRAVVRAGTALGDLVGVDASPDRHDDFAWWASYSSMNRCRRCASVTIARYRPGIPPRVAQLLERLEGEIVLLLDQTADEVRQSAVGERDVTGTLDNRDRHVGIEAAQPGCRGHAAGDADDDDDVLRPAIRGGSHREAPRRWKRGAPPARRGDGRAALIMKGQPSSRSLPLDRDALLVGSRSVGTGTRTSRMPSS
jgi:hypothetical protein